MTIEQLLEMPASQLEAMTDQQLEDFFRPFFPTTRPDLARANKKERKTATGKTITPEMLLKLKELGLEDIL